MLLRDRNDDDILSEMEMNQGRLYTLLLPTIEMLPTTPDDAMSISLAVSSTPKRTAIVIKQVRGRFWNTS